MLAIANTTDVDGRYLFGGYRESATPFTIGADGSVVYNGDQGQRTLQISDSRFVAINDSGADVVPAHRGRQRHVRLGRGRGQHWHRHAWRRAASSNAASWVADTYTVNFLSPTSYEVRDSANALVATGAFSSSQSLAFAGIEMRIDGTPAAGDTFTVAPSAQRDVFATLDRLVTTLEAPSGNPAERAQMHGDVGQRLADLDNALAHLIEARGEIGARVRGLDQQEALNADFAVHLKTTLSAVRDLDYAEALSRLSQELFGLDAAQQAFARAQNLSLFKYI